MRACMSAAMWRYGLPTMFSSGTPEKYCRPRAASRSYGCAETIQSDSAQANACCLSEIIPACQIQHSGACSASRQRDQNVVTKINWLCWHTTHTEDREQRQH